MFGWIGSLLKIAASVCGWGEQRSADKNAPDMKVNADAAVKEEIRTAATDAVAKSDEDAIRKQLADQ